MVYLDKKVLQKDMRIRLPESVKENLRITEGDFLEIFLNTETNCLILRSQKDKGVHTK